MQRVDSGFKTVFRLCEKDIRVLGLPLYLTTTINTVRYRKISKLPINYLPLVSTQEANLIQLTFLKIFK